MYSHMEMYVKVRFGFTVTLVHVCESYKIEFQQTVSIYVNLQS